MLLVLSLFAVYAAAAALCLLLLALPRRRGIS